jgi:CheY-like chemotaxis protein
MHSILAVAASASMRQMASLALKNAGVNLVEAVDGQDAREKAALASRAAGATVPHQPPHTESSNHG